MIKWDVCAFIASVMRKDLDDGAHIEISNIPFLSHLFMFQCIEVTHDYRILLIEQTITCFCMG